MSRYQLTYATPEHVLHPHRSIVARLFLGVTLLGCGITIVARWAERQTGRSVPSRKNTAKIDLCSIGVALDAFAADCGRYPSEGEGVASLFSSPLNAASSWNGPYLKSGQCLVDPWGQRYRYRSSSPTAVTPYRLFSLGPEGKEGTSDDIGMF